MSYLPRLFDTTEKKKSITAWNGLNYREIVSDSEIVDCKNITTSDYPALSVRRQAKQAFAFYYGIDAYRRLYNFDNGILVVEKENNNHSIRYYYHGETYHIQVMFDGDPKFITDNMSIVKYENTILFFYNDYDTHEIRMSTFNLASLPAPTSNILVSSNGTSIDIPVCALSFKNRVMVAFNKTVQICYEGNPFNWDTFYVEGSEQGSYLPNEAACQEIPLTTGGRFTACCYYKDRPLLFKNNEMYALYGSWTPYSLVKIADVGCVSMKSISMVSNNLYFLSTQGVMVYSGGLPNLISDNIVGENLFLGGINTCSDFRFYYINDYVFDSYTNCWGKTESELKPLISSANTAYFLSRRDPSSSVLAGSFVLVDDNSPTINSLLPIDWWFITKKFHEYEPQNKLYTGINLRVLAKQSVSIKVEVSCDGGDFMMVANQNLEKDRSEVINVKLAPCEAIQIKVSGSGRVVVPYLERVYSSMFA